MSADSIDLVALKAATQPQDLTYEPVPREMEFDVKYTSPDGSRYSATLISCIKTGEQRVQIGQMAAQMASGVSWASLPPSTQTRIWCLSNIAIGLQDAPEWVLTWSQEDDSLLYGISRVQEGHEIDYFRGHPEEDQEDSGQPRLEISEARTPRSASMPRPSNNAAPFQTGSP